MIKKAFLFFASLLCLGLISLWLHPYNGDLTSTFALAIAIIGGTGLVLSLIVWLIARPRE